MNKFKEIMTFLFNDYTIVFAPFIGFFLGAIIVGLLDLCLGLCGVF